MKLIRYGVPGVERPAVVDDAGQTFDARPITADFDSVFFAGPGIAALRKALGRGELPRLDLAGERLGPPIARPPAVVCIGMNYAAHAAESGSTPPEHPIVFLKHPACIVGPNDDVELPRSSTKTDWEVELAVVMGGTPRYLRDPSEGWAYVAGYALSNDISERELQLERSGGQWSKGKCAPTFNPLGPWLRPAEEVDANDLRLRSSVNGEPRQDSTTADLIFSIGALIADLSHYMLLMPGDLINTGTPEGVALSGRFPYLQQGDVISMEIDELGRQEQRVIASAHAPTS